jgi:hypothetical protein
MPIGSTRRNKYVSQLYRSLADHGVLDASEFAALVRLPRERSTEFELPRDLRPKNAYNANRPKLSASDLP